MKQLSTKIIAISALVIASFSATAQSNGQRSMTKRGDGNQQAPTNQSSTTYSNGNQGSQGGNRNGQYNNSNQQSSTNQGSTTYSNGNQGSQSGNRNGQYNSGNNDNRSGQYNNGQHNAGNNNQYGNRNQSFGNNNRRDQGGRREENFSNRRPFFGFFFGKHKEYRRDDYNRGRERRHFDRNSRW